jgi:hypothetical protein
LDIQTERSKHSADNFLLLLPAIYQQPKETMKYLPFLDGKYSVAPGLLPMMKAQSAADTFIFQIDDDYKVALQNKEACRNEDIGKYFCEKDFRASTASCVNRYIANQLVTEYPEHFEFEAENGQFTFHNKKTDEQFEWNKDWVSFTGGRYLSLFDALGCQVQEDLVVCQLDGDKDWTAAIHLCAPNHWAAQDKIGRRFDRVHAPVPGMEKTMPYYFKILQTIIQRGTYTRFAWGISTDDRLNHHPQSPPGIDAIKWYGRSLDEKSDELYVRVERQNLVGFSQANALLFTIRTYFYKTTELSKEERSALMAAVETMSEQSLIYKGLFGKKDILRELIFR